MAKKSLLLVDADSKSLRMLEVSLRKSGFSVTTAVHAVDARDKLKHATPDLIITDTKLPGDESGFDFVGKLKSKTETANIPIIFLSSENRLEQKVAGLELGVEDYLTKPIYIKEVLTRVRVLLDKREKQTLERRERSSSFAGLLGDMGLVDLMQTVEIGRKTGKLFIETRGLRGQVSFREGKVCDARSGRLSGERAFYRMLVWNDGTFSMEFSAHDDADVIELSTQGLLMEGMRRVDEWGRLIEQLPPLDHRFEIDFVELVDRLAEIPDEINALLRHFDGKRTLIDVVDETDFGDLEALEIASKLYFEGLIFDVADREPAPETAAHREAWLQEPNPTTGSGVDDVDDDGGLLVPNDTMPPMAALPPAPVARPAPTPTAATGFLAPPTGASESSLTSAVPATSTARPTMPPTITSRPAVLSDLPRMTPRPAAPSRSPSSADADLGAIDTAITVPEAPALASLSSMLPTSTALPTIAPRPLPVAGAGTGEARSVLPRSAVGARAWSTKDAAERNDDDTTDGGGRSPFTEAITSPGMQVPISTEGSDDGDPLESSLARDLGLSRDELKLAIAAGASRPPRPADVVEHERDLERAINAQLDAEDPAGADRRAVDHDDEETLTSFLRPPPAPLTSAPSMIDAPAPTTPPMTPAEASDDIHTRRTRLDLEPQREERAGVSRKVAAAIFIAGFAIVLFFVLVMTRTPPPATTDAGTRNATASDAGVVDEIVIAAADAPTTPPAVTKPEPTATRPEPTSTRPEPTATRPEPTATRPEPTSTTARTPTTTTKDVDEPKPVATTAEAKYAQQLKIAEGLAQRADFGRAVRAYKAALTAMPNGLAAHLGLGNAYYELNSLNDALTHLERARSIAPRDPQVHVLLGAAYQSSGRTTDAVEAYERYLALAPDGKFARDVRGILRGIKR